GAPLELILPEAAAWIMVLDNFEMAIILSKYLSARLITCGTWDELLGQLLLIQVFDAIIIQKSVRDRIMPIHFSTNIPVIDFIASLFPEYYEKIICEATPDNMHGATLKEAFGNAVIYFTHWGKVVNSSMIDDEGVWLAMCHGIALQCHNYEDDIDFFIPVLHDCRQTLSCFAISAILIQLKNCDKVQAANISASALHYFISRN
ncbi:hypothetical protein BU17DRAFT_59666, partial [Hysterangium stoloniferum]